MQTDGVAESPQSVTHIQSEDRRAGRALEWLAPAALVVLTLAVFFPATRFGFTNWDDPTNFVENASFRGLTAAHFRWFFTTYYMGHYQPFNWLTFALDHRAWGLDPQHFHLTQIMLHALAVLCVYVLIRDLLAVFAASTVPLVHCGCAAMATSLYAIHPLRVESAAWLSARTDLLATIFGCLSVTAYLRWLVSSRRGWWWASFLSFVLAVLSKEMVVTIPLVCIVLNWALRSKGRARVPGGSFWSVTIRELSPFFIVAIVAGVNAFFAAGSALSLSSTISDRAAQLVYSYCFYLKKTLWPTKLSPFYEFPGTFGWNQPGLFLDAAAIAAIATLLVLFRRRAPGLVAAALCYLILLLPVSGLAPRGPQLVADRYAYIGTIPLFAALAFLMARGWNRWSRVIVVGTGILLVASGAVSRTQLAYWSDPTMLWSHAIEIDSHNGTAHANLGQAYDMAGRNDDAVREYQTALRIRPTHPDMHRALAAIFNRQGQLGRAIMEYQEDIKQNPERASSHYYLGTIFERLKMPALATEQFQAALAIDSHFSLAEVGLARLLLHRRDARQAEPHLRRALELDGSNTEALELLAQICTNTDRKAEAVGLYDRLIVEARRRGRLEVVRDLDAIRRGLARETASGPASP